MTIETSTVVSAGDPPGWYNNNVGAWPPNVYGPITTNIGPMGPVGPAAFEADGLVKCKDLEVDGVSMKQFIAEMEAIIPIFMPPNDAAMNHPTVVDAVDAYEEARRALIKAKAHLDFLIKLTKEHK